MEKQYNPLRSWRGSELMVEREAAALLGMSWEEYLILESPNPGRSFIKSDQIIKISQVTGIPLPVLVDYLTQKESVSC